MIAFKFIIRILILCAICVKNYVFCNTTPTQTVVCDGSSNSLVELLNVAESVIKSAKHYVKIETRINNEHHPFHPMDCADILENSPSSTSGIYTIWPPSRIVKGPISVFCDMKDDGGAWTVIQRRGNFDSPKDYFFRDWTAYKNGFGDPAKDFWLGNDNIFALTNIRSATVKFDLSDWEGNKTYAMYDSFWIDDETYNYTIHISGYRGNAGDSITNANGHPFTTKDRDNDKYEKNCAEVFKGAWWYVACHGSNLNGQYLKGVHESYADGVEWSSFRGQHYSLMDTVIKIRPKNFQKDFDVTPQ